MSEAADPTPDGTPEEPAPDDDSIEGPKGGPRRLLIAGAVAAVVFVALVVATRGDDAGGGGCLTGLADHLPGDAEVVSGSDSDRIEDAGYDIGTRDGLVDAAVEASYQPDPLTGRVTQQLLSDDPEAVTGYTAGDVRCWVGDQVGSFVAEGDFDADRVADAEAADDLALDGDRLAYDSNGDPDAWLTTTGGADTPAGAAVGKLDDLGAVTFSGFPAGDDAEELLWVGLGLGRDDDWELVGVWAFRDDDTAEASVATVVEAIEAGEVPSMIEGDVADLVERDGSLLTLRAPMRVEPSEWRTPFVQFDPMFGALTGLNDIGTSDDSGTSDSGDDSDDGSGG